MTDDFPKSIQEVTTIPSLQIICRSAACEGKASAHKQVERTEDNKPPVKIWVCLECGARTPA